jgi:arginine repressor
MKQVNLLKTESTLIRRKKIVTLDELATSLHCSKRTVQRRLAQLKTIRSYNRNGQYYTLEEIPKFDTNGLWHYRETYFSRFGNLTQTFIQLVQTSGAGLTSHEAGDLIGLRPSSFLWNFHMQPCTSWCQLWL